jgi:hypothetical protein
VGDNKYCGPSENTEARQGLHRCSRPSGCAIPPICRSTSPPARTQPSLLRLLNMATRDPTNCVTGFKSKRID